MVNVSITVNGQVVTAEIDERMLLLEFIRDVAGLTGTHNGCLEARCGCCSVELDGSIVKSCNVLALQGRRPERGHDRGPVATAAASSGADHLTEPRRDVPAAGHARRGRRRPAPVQAAFHRCHALQCGFCTPAW